MVTRNKKWVYGNISCKPIFKTVFPKFILQKIDHTPLPGVGGGGNMPPYITDFAMDFSRVPFFSKKHYYYSNDFVEAAQVRTSLQESPRTSGPSYKSISESWY